MSKEFWKPVVGYEGLYDVSTLGRVRSLDRYVRGPYGCMRFAKGGLRKLSLTSNGYLCIRLANDTHKELRFVHVLVASAFHGQNPKGLDVGHKDGCRTNSRATNLSYVTRGDNNREIVYHGRRKLTVAQVIDIKTRTYEHGDKIQLERKLGLANGTIHYILTGRLYAHISPK